MRILICGDRNWNDWKAIEDYIKTLPDDTVVIHGGCKGADIMAGWYARMYGLEVIPFLAEWNRYGRAAGPIRNKRMIVEGKPDLVVAFHNDLANSRGTKDMIKQAKEHGIPYEVNNSEL